MKRNLTPACLLTLSLFGFCSCGNHDTGSDASSTDSTAIDNSTITLSNLDDLLPDTTYSSVSAIKSRTVIVDTTVNPTVNCTVNMYANAPGILTFRGGAYRDADFHGTVKGTPSEVVVDWTFTTEQSTPSETMGSWGGGTGWTGQPLYIEWPDSCVKRFKEAKVVNADFNKREVIVGSLAGKIYFIDYATGKASREAINVTNPIKGTVSLDPTLNGNLYVGHGIPVERPFGAVVIDLYRGVVANTFGEDPKAPRRWGAYDSSALRVGQFLFRPGENGMLYKYTVEPGRLKLHSYMSYTSGGSLGFEASMSAYANYGYTADNSGSLVCTNLNTMRPVWHYAMGDDTDASPVLLVEDGKPFIYVGTEIDKQRSGSAKLAKIDGLTGRPVWTTSFEGRMEEVGEKHFDGGFYATLLPGTGNCSDLLFCNVVRNLKGQNGEFVAVEKETGKVRYATPLKYYAWSSPVGFLNEKNEMFVLTGDCSGRIYLIKASDGTILFSKIIGSNFESSPAVVGNEIVVGSRGNKIFKMSIH